ncbi:Fur family transcriptional regulator [Chloroflexota bacterium]
MRLIERKVAATLRQNGYKLTSQRRMVIQTIISTQDHLTPSAIYEKVHQDHPGIGFTTVYRTLEILARPPAP